MTEDAGRTPAERALLTLAAEVREVRAEVRAQSDELRALRERLDQPEPPRDRLLTAGELAQRLTVSEDWVRRHVDQLGALRLPDSPRAERRRHGNPVPRARFDWTIVRELLEAGVCRQP